MKAYYGDAAPPDSDFGFAWLPRIVGDHSQLPMTLATRDGVIRGIFDPRGKGVYLQSAPGPAGGDAMTIHPRALDYPQSFLSGVIPDEAELTAGQRVEPGRSYGFFTDTTLCIGCKACKEWNALPADDLGLRGTSHDNAGDLSATTWRHVYFIEHIAENGERATEMPPFQSNWLMMSDVCKHCSPAPCLEACPTGALFRTEFDTVVVQ